MLKFVIFDELRIRVKRVGEQNFLMVYPKVIKVWIAG